MTDDSELRGLSIAELLESEPISSGGFDILAGAEGLDRDIRWVHIADSHKVEPFLEGGELVLTTAATFRTSPSATAEFLDQLERVEAAGTVVELVDEFAQPDFAAAEVLGAAAAGRSLPVIVLLHRIKFVAITELAHRRLLATQLIRLERAQEIHETYTQLSLERAEAQTIVDRTAGLLAAPVVLEDVSHRVLAHAGRGSEAIAAEWTDLIAGDREGSGPTWHQTPVGLRARRWGRLVVPDAVDAGVALEQIIERAGEALTLTRMADRDEQDLLLQAQSGLIRRIADAEDLDERAARARARSLGFAPAEDAALIPVVVRLVHDSETDPTRIQLQERGLTQEIVSATARLGLPCLMTSLQSGAFGFVLSSAEASSDRSRRRSAQAESEDSVLGRLFAEVSDYAARWSVGVGRSSSSLLAAVPGLDSAAQIAEAASTLDVRERPFYRSSDVRLRGLLALLADDARLRAFVDGELGPLLDAAEAGGTGSTVTSGVDEETLDFLELFLSHGGNKSAVARAGFLSRPALYSRIEKLQNRLGVSLDDAESRTALHLALLWWRING